MTFADHLLFAALICPASLATQPVPQPATAPPTLAVSLSPTAVHFRVDAQATAGPFVAGVIGSLSPDLQHYLTGVPPLLLDHVVLGAGFGSADHGYALALAESLLPPGIAIHVQGVTLIDGAIGVSDVHEFVLDVTSPAGPGR